MRPRSSHRARSRGAVHVLVLLPALVSSVTACASSVPPAGGSTTGAVAQAMSLVRTR